MCFLSLCAKFRTEQDTIRSSRGKLFHTNAAETANSLVPMAVFVRPLVTPVTSPSPLSAPNTYGERYPVFFVVVDEGERQRHVERRVLERTGSSLARLKRRHQIHPTRRSLHLKRLDELDAEYRHKQTLKFHVNPCAK